MELLLLKRGVNGTVVFRKMKFIMGGLAMNQSSDFAHPTKAYLVQSGRKCVADCSLHVDEQTSLM